MFHYFQYFGVWAPRNGGGEGAGGGEGWGGGNKKKKNSNFFFFFAPPPPQASRGGLEAPREPLATKFSFARARAERRLNS